MTANLRVYQRAARVCKGYIVKREWFEEDPSTKKQVKHRKEIGRIYHSRNAAETLMALLKKQNPDWVLYVHEKMGQDGLSHDPT